MPNNQQVKEFMDRGWVRNDPKFYSCGICDCYHSAEWDGDCREDDNRFAADDLDVKFGWDGWEEVDMP